MKIWIRSTAKTNLVKCDCLSVINGSEIYNKEQWEYNGYTICQCYGNNLQKSVTPLGTYKTKEHALEVLDEIQDFIEYQGNSYLKTNEMGIPDEIKNYGKVYEMPIE